MVKHLSSEAIVEEIPPHIDLFICSASFESRSFNLAEKLKSNSISCSVICYNEDQIKLVGRNVAHLHILLTDKNPRLVQFSLTNPIITFENFSRAINDAIISRPDPLVVVDITTFTRESLLILVKYLRERLPDNGENVYFIYTTAEEYSVGLDVEEKWLTKGVSTIRSVLGYPGEFYASKKLHLVVLVGFESERVEKLIESYEPSIISLGIPTASEVISNKHFEVNKYNLNNLINMYSSVNLFEFSCINPQLTKESLDIFLKGFHKEHNIVLSPLNNKISTLGAAMYCFEKPEIQMCYVVANNYNHLNYSAPGNDFILTTIY